MNLELASRIESLCSKAPGSWQFILNFGALCHGVDDIIDDDNPDIKDKKAHALAVAQIAMDVYSCPFYHNNLWLYPLCANIHRVYADSVAWENSDVPWMKQYADTIRCCGNEVVLAILKHCCGVGFDELNQLSLLIREDSYHNHHDAEGKPE